MAKKNGKRPASKSSRAKPGSQIDLALPEAARKLSILYIARNLIEPDPDQPRDEPDADLMESIRGEGILQPITVRPHPKKTGLYTIVDGERRWKGAQGVQNMIPCVVRQDQEDELHRIITQLVSNTGKPLEPVEEARAIARAAELSGKSVSDLAEMLGRPRSSVGDRLTLLQLGPWLNLVESGKVQLSHVMREVAPLRGVPDEYHRKAIAEMDLARLGKNASLEDFSSEVEAAYRPFMYPLQKGTAKYGSGSNNPTFDTKNHSKECDCGGINFSLDWGTKRKCCGNPAWWGPLDREGKKEQRQNAPAKKASATGRRLPKLYMPEGAKHKRLKGYSSNVGGTNLAGDDGKWSTQIDFDPRPIDFKPATLLHWQSDYNQGVSTTDAATVKEAQKAWQERWDARARELVKPVLARAEKYAVGGNGARGLLYWAVQQDPDGLFELIASIGVAIPEKIMNGERWQIKKAELVTWVDHLSVDEICRILSVIALIEAEDMKSPVDQADAERNKALLSIRASTPPWLKKPTGKGTKEAAKPKAGKPQSRKAKSGAAADEEDAPPPKLSHEDQMDLIDAAREHEEDDADELAGVAEDE